MPSRPWWANDSISTQVFCHSRRNKRAAALMCGMRDALRWKWCSFSGSRKPRLGSCGFQTGLALLSTPHPIPSSTAQTSQSSLPGLPNKWLLEGSVLWKKKLKSTQKLDPWLPGVGEGISRRREEVWGIEMFCVFIVVVVSRCVVCIWQNSRKCIYIYIFFFWDEEFIQFIFQGNYIMVYFG